MFMCMYTKLHPVSLGHVRWLILFYGHLAISSIIYNFLAYTFMHIILGIL